jgi:hypothetical protein
MLGAWDIRTRPKKKSLALVYASLAGTRGESNPIAARDFICVVWPR